MRFDLSQEEYSNALKSALHFIDTGDDSSGVQAMERLLASIWDTIAGVNTIECLMLMDSATKDIAIALIIGRAYYGRPSNLTVNTQLEANFQKEYRAQVMASRSDAPK